MSTAQTLEVPGHQVVQFLGSGARSTIWQIRDRETGGLLALKRVVKRGSRDGRFLEQALNEYEVSRHFDHPVVRRIHRARRIKRWLALREIQLFMEFCGGATIQEDRPRSVGEILRIFVHVAEALAHINAKGFVHADMKPNNIIVSPDGRVKIIDLGQSCPLGTVKQRIQGTPDFIAPEQVRRLPLDARTDVFNFGAALYWTLTGRAIPTVLPKKSPAGIGKRETTLPPEQLNDQVPPSLSKLVLDCVESSPPRRPKSMNDVLARLNLIAHTLNRQEPPPQDSPPCPT
ncbi:MAG TPA: serine/threonine-protein kinase [Phycisphaerae bacterium]|nr:serine/threonine-protein kinase [Phycisphaerae bacterium]